jgi:hypothetical protein
MDLRETDDRLFYCEDDGKVFYTMSIGRIIEWPDGFEAFSLQGYSLGLFESKNLAVQEIGRSFADVISNGTFHLYESVTMPITPTGP